MRTISIKQPWAWLIVCGGKDIENRTWYSSYRGALWVHASSGCTRSEYFECVEFVKSFDPALAARIPAHEDLVYGAVIGVVTMADCVRRHSSPWFQGPYGFVLAAPRQISPVKAKGSLGMWLWNHQGPLTFIRSILAAIAGAQAMRWGHL